MNNSITVSNSDIRTGPLFEMGPDWVKRHIEKYNGLYCDQKLSTIRLYFITHCSNLKPQSLRNLSFGFKNSVREVLAEKYIFDPKTKFNVDQFFLEYQKLKAVTTQRKTIEHDDIAKLTELAGPKTSLLVSLLYATGLRVTEACNIKLSKIYPVKNDPTLNEIHVIRKGGCEGSLIAPVLLIDSIRIIFKGKKFLLESSRGNQYKRNGIYCLLRDASLYHLGYAISPHMLRHAFATHMMSNHPDKLEAIMRQGGWSNPTTLIKTYVHQKLDKSDLPELRTAM